MWDLPREAPFTDMSGRTPQEIAEAGAIVAAHLSIDNRLINRPIYMGGAKAYEVTLLLRPGWAPIPELDGPFDDDQAITDAKAFWINEFLSTRGSAYGDPLSIYHTRGEGFHGVRDVGRLWIFPDDHRYLDPDDPTQSPLARLNWPAHLYSPYDPDALIYAHPTLGASIAEAQDWVPRRRPMQATIARRSGSSDRTPVNRRTATRRRTCELRVTNYELRKGRKGDACFGLSIGQSSIANRQSPIVTIANRQSPIVNRQ